MSKVAATESKPIPGRLEVKAMMRAGDWDGIGFAFNFTPRFVTSVSGSQSLDWNSVPDALAQVLFSRPIPAGMPLHAVVRMVRRMGKKRQSAKRRPSGVPTQRLMLWTRQEGICHYCKIFIPFKKWSIDHRIPLSRGGHNDYTNKIGCCSTCNNAKGCLTEEEYAPIHSDRAAVRALLRKTEIERNSQILSAKDCWPDG